MAQQLVKALLEKNMTICTAESCTGGLLASMIVDVAGASDVFGRGFITYANRAKHDLLGVTWEALEQYGAVSPQVAEQMAQGAARAGEADTVHVSGISAAAVLEGNGGSPACVKPRVVGVGITGIAGPGGGTEEKPVGLVYIGCHVPGIPADGVDAENIPRKGRTYVKECHFTGDRRTVRESAAAEAVRFALECIG